MIKIVEKGTLKQEKCQYCGCLFTYEEEDIRKEAIPSLNFHSGLGTEKTINCPQCSKVIYLERVR